MEEAKESSEKRQRTKLIGKTTCFRKKRDNKRDWYGAEAWEVRNEQRSLPSLLTEQSYLWSKPPRWS